MLGLVAAGCGRTICAYSLAKEIVCAVVRGITHGHCRSSFQDLTFSKIWAAKVLDAWFGFLGFVFRSREPPIGILTGCKFQEHRRCLLVHGNWLSRFCRPQESGAMAPKQEKKSRSFDCKRSFSFAEISHGSHIGKQILCVTCTISLAPLEAKIEREQTSGSQKEIDLLLALPRNMCTVREDPACHTSNAAVGLCHSFATQDRPSTP